MRDVPGRLVEYAVRWSGTVARSAPRRAPGHRARPTGNTGPALDPRGHQRPRRRCSGLHEVLRCCHVAGLSHVLQDGTLACDRVAGSTEKGSDLRGWWGSQLWPGAASTTSSPRRHAPTAQEPGVRMAPREPRRPRRPPAGAPPPPHRSPGRPRRGRPHPPGCSVRVPRRAEPPGAQRPPGVVVVQQRPDGGRGGIRRHAARRRQPDATPENLTTRQRPGVPWRDLPGVTAQEDRL